MPVQALLLESSRLAAWVEARQPDVAAAAARVTQAEAAVGQSRVIPNPTLSAAVGGLTLGGTNPPGLPYGDTMNWSVGLQETIELGKRGPRAQAATFRRDSARASALDVLSDKVAQARDALARMVYATERQHVISVRLQSARNVAALERVRLQHGDISGIDQDRLELDVDIVMRQLADEQVNLEAARADCATLLLGSCSIIDATMDTVDRSAPVPENYADIEALLRARPDIRATLLAESAARTDAVLARRQAIPDPTVGVSYIRDYLTVAGDQPHTLAASVSLPLPIFDHGQHQARQAEGAATELGAIARGLTVRGLADARTLLARRDVLREKLQTLTQLGIPRSESVLKSSDEAYHRGQLSLTDLLIVRREHASLLLDAVDTRYDLFTVRNTLYRVLGLDVPRAPSVTRPSESSRTARP